MRPSRLERTGQAGRRAESFRLSDTSHTLELTTESPNEMAPQIEHFFAHEFRVDEKQVLVNPLTGGRSSTGVFDVKLDDRDVGVFKVFNSPEAAQNEVNMMRLLHAKHMKTYDVVSEKGQATVKVLGNSRGGLLMTTAPGTTIEGQLNKLPPPGERGHEEAVVALEASAKAVARGLAEMHSAFATGALQTGEQKNEQVQATLAKLNKIKSKLTKKDHEAIASKLAGQIIPEFMSSHVPATAIHGDAHVGNFVVDKDFKLHVIDVGPMKWSLDAQGRGKKSGASDAGRFMQSMEMFGEGKLSQSEVSHVQQAFLDEYFASSKLSPKDFEAGIKLFRADVEIAFIGFAAGQEQIDSGIRRLGTLLGVAVTGSGARE